MMFGVEQRLQTYQVDMVWRTKNVMKKGVGRHAHYARRFCLTFVVIVRNLAVNAAWNQLGFHKSLPLRTAENSKYRKVYISVSAFANQACSQYFVERNFWLLQRASYHMHWRERFHLFNMLICYESRAAKSFQVLVLSISSLSHETSLNSRVFVIS